MVKALPYNDSHDSCAPCTYVWWVQVVATFDAGGRPSVIQHLRKREPFTGHVCRGGVPRTAARTPLLRAIAQNGNLGTTALSGAAIHKTIRRRAEHAGYDPAALTKLGGHSLRAGFVATTYGRSGALSGALGPGRSEFGCHHPCSPCNHPRREHRSAQQDRRHHGNHARHHHDPRTRRSAETLRSDHRILNAFPRRTHVPARMPPLPSI